MTPSISNQIDHLIFATPDLQQGIRLIEEKVGATPTIGGRHLDFGTHNALLKIGEKTYLEIIAPDPASTVPKSKWWMGLNKIQEPGLIWWAAKAIDLPKYRRLAEAMGWELGEPLSGSRRLPQGETLKWQLTDPYRVTEKGTLPFLIDWQNGPHPTDTLTPSDCTLIEFQLVHPEPDKIRSYLTVVDLQVPISYSEQAGIRATLATPLGLAYL